MLRPREAIAQHCARIGIDASIAIRIHRPDRGIGRTIALIDGLPDLQTEELIGANVVTRTWVDDAVPIPHPHATFAACVLVGRRHGLVPGARLLAASVVSADGSIAPARVAAAIDWARKSGAGIIVIPMGDPREHDEVSESIAAAFADDIVIVAAAGNAHPHPLRFPARLPSVIAVGACDERGILLEDSCRTPRLDLVVPALGILAAIGPGREAPRSGTSVAAALAAGVLLLDFSSAIDSHPQEPT